MPTHGNTLKFDPENRLLGGSYQANGYTGDGLRAWRRTSATGPKTYFLYDGETPVCELGSTGSVTAVNTFGADGLASRHTSAGDVTYTYDPFGSVSQVLTGDGVLVGDIGGAYSYQDWQPGENDPAPYSYGGQNGYYADNINALILCTHRFYDQFAGRFLTRDPMGYAGGINLYAYAGNNPVNESDPSGFDPGVPEAPWQPGMPIVLPSNPAGLPPGWTPTRHGGPEGPRPGGGSRWISPGGGGGLEYDPARPGIRSKTGGINWHLLRSNPAKPGTWLKCKDHLYPGDTIPDPDPVPIAEPILPITNPSPVRNSGQDSENPIFEQGDDPMPTVDSNLFNPFDPIE